jgi:hypothetical protein
MKNISKDIYLNAKNELFFKKTLRVKNYENIKSTSFEGLPL